MYSETMAAIKSFLSGITINGTTLTPIQGNPDKRLKSAQDIGSLSVPRLTITLYDDAFDPTRTFPTPEMTFDDDVDDDSTSVDSIPAPSPRVLFYQIEFRTSGTRVQHDIDEFKRKFLLLFDDNGKDLTVSKSLGGHTFDQTVHSQIVSYIDHSEYGKNQRKARIIFSISVQTWVWDDVDTPDTIPLLNQRVLNRLRPGTQDDTDIVYSTTLDT